MPRNSLPRAAAAILAALLSLTATARAQPKSEIVGNLRIQVCSPTLVRIEERGPRGFEDRPTFHITGRDWPGATYERWGALDNPTISCQEGGRTVWTLIVPPGATDARGVHIQGPAGEDLWHYTAEAATADAWLPAPADLAGAGIRSWSFADTPRLVPPAWGALPPPDGAPADHAGTSGWDAENSATDLYVFLPAAGGYAQLRSDLLRLVGRTPLPPAFLLGFIDSRYYVYTQQSALDRIADYRSRGFPLDVLVIDTDWRIGASHGYEVNRELFPDMDGFLRAAHEQHARIMFNDHPEPRFDSGLDPRELTYRRDNLQRWLGAGVDVWWYDRNWNIGIKEPIPGLRREVWGMRLYRDITLDAWRRAAPPGSAPRRPAIMANVFGIDNGRRNRPPDVAARLYPIQWTGDTSATWPFLRAGVENTLVEGVRGLNAYISEDLGGHAGTPDDELYIRFMQFGALSPVMRPHCTKGADRTPWNYGSGAEEIVREYAKLRERLLPVLYAAAARNHETGEPIARRLDLEFPGEPEAARNDQYLLGDDLLVAPILTGATDATPVPATWLTHGNAGGLAAEYFSNGTLEGPPTVTRTDRQVNFDWGRASPDPKIPEDHFSARWTGTITVPAGAPPVRLGVSVDDGVRLFLDDTLVIDAWKPQAESRFRAAPVLNAGEPHTIRLEYFDDRFDAVCRLTAERDTPPGPASREVWIPPGAWIDAWTGIRTVGPRVIPVKATLAQLPLFVREGSIVTLAPDLAYVTERPWDHLTIEAAAPQTGEVTRTLYEDDMLTEAYLAGNSRSTTLRVGSHPDAGTVTVAVHPAHGAADLPPAARTWTIALRPPPWAVAAVPTVRIDGKEADAVAVRTTPWPAAPFGLAFTPGQAAAPRSDPAPRVVIDLPPAPVATPRTVEFRWPPQR